MNDCSNADIRDRLPDLLHERLDASTRRAVTAHVDECVDCREELQLLTSVHGILLAQSTRIDTLKIAQAIPAYRPAAARPATRSWATTWRIAAAVTLLAVGGGSVAVLRHEQSVTPIVTDTVRPIRPSLGIENPTRPSNPAQTASAPVAEPTTPTRVATARPARGLAMTGGLADLSEGELQSLLREIEGLQAVPITEPDPVILPVSARGSSSPEGT